MAAASSNDPGIVAKKLRRKNTVKGMFRQIYRMIIKDLEPVKLNVEAIKNNGRIIII